MSGHSKWSNIKTRKLAQDKKRAQVFTKLLRAIATAARENPDQETNPKLRLAVDRARSFNVPKDNIDRAVRREGGENIEPFSLDALGPGGTTLIIEGATDNRNRTLGEIRKILETYGGKLGQEGSARWAFARKGVLAIDIASSSEKGDALVLALIGAGAEDVHERDGAIEVIVSPGQLDIVRKNLAAQNISVADALLGWVPNQPIGIPEEQRGFFTALLEALDEHQDVQAIWSNER